MIGAPATGEVRADVVVIGGGLSGAMAALAARSRGRSVALVRRSWGLTALTSGALQVAPDPLATPHVPLWSRATTAAGAAALARARPDHPYAELGDRLQDLPAALAFAERELAGAISFEPVDTEGRLLLGPTGQPVRCAGSLASQAPGDLLRVRGTVVIGGIAASPATDASVLARAAQDAADRAGLPLRFEARDLASLPWSGLRPHEVYERIAAAPGELAAVVQAVLPPDAGLVILPPFVGEHVDAVARRTGVPCAEWLAATPSLPGLRLQRALDARMEAAGVALVAGEAFPGGTGVRVRSADPPVAPAAAFVPGGPPALPAATPSWPVRGSIVLATGRFVGGGLRREGRLREGVLDLPVWLQGQVDEGRWLGDFTAHELAEGQPAFRAGLRVDARLRPLHRDGAPADALACGDVLGGTDLARDGTWAGVAILTGWLAGLAA